MLGNGRPCIVTLVERITGLVMIGKMKARTRGRAQPATIALIASAPLPVRTITADNGTEFHGYGYIEDATGSTFFFATSHHSWERGSSENVNGLIRRYLPKRTSMNRLSQARCDSIASRLNNRPRRRLDDLTPKEACGALCE